MAEAGRREEEDAALLPHRAGRAELGRFLDGLRAPEGALTVASAAGAPEPASSLLSRSAWLFARQRDAVDGMLRRSTTGAYLFWAPDAVHLVVPPFPVRRGETRPGWWTEPLRAMLTSQPRVGVVLLRLQGYAVGVFQGDALAASKVGTANVHGRHKAGGWSQQRFARRRENQARELFDRVCRHVQEHFLPVERSLDYVLLGGERQTLLGFQERCPYLAKFGPRLLTRTLLVHRPDRAALDGILTEVWKSQVLSLLR